MAFKLLLLISLAIALASPAERPDGKRLIKLKLGEPAKWMTPEDMKEMISDIGDKAFGYLDLTREGVDNTENSAEARSLSEETYPDQALQKEGMLKLISSLKKDRLEESVKKLSSFHNRHSWVSFGPSSAEGWLNDEITSILVNYDNSSSIRHISDPALEDPKYEDVAYKQKNILVKLEGQDPDLKSELVILGAHYDTIIGSWVDGTVTSKYKRAPGADDNASGCAVLLEVLRVLVQSGAKLKRTVEFHFYPGKEIGVLGSSDVVKNYKNENAVVKGMLNLDSCGNGKTVGYVAKEFNNELATSEKLTDFVKMLVGEYVERGFELKNIHCQRTLNCFSDHYFWTVKGFPSASLAEFDQSPHYHLESDTVETLNFELVNEFAKVALAFLVELADLLSIPDSNSGSGRPEAGWTLVGLNLLFWIWSRF